MTDLAFAPARKLAAMIRGKKIGCAELLDHYLARVEKYNPALNAIIVTDIPAAKKRARAADRALANGDSLGTVPRRADDGEGSLRRHRDCRPHGACRSSKSHVAKRNALAVDRWIGAGAIVFGKTNVPMWLADSQSFNAIYGTTNSPWNLGRNAGRLFRRIVGRRRRGHDRHRNRQRHRLLDPQSGDLLRHLRSQADLRHLPAARPRGARPHFAGRHQRHRTAGAQRRRSRSRAVGDGGTGRDRQRGLPARAARAKAEGVEGLSRRGDAERSDIGSRPRRAGLAAKARRFSGQEKSQGQRQGAARNRHGAASTGCSI